MGWRKSIPRPERRTRSIGLPASRSPKTSSSSTSRRWCCVRMTAIGTAHTSAPITDRKSTRLNSSHLGISYAVFCLKKNTEGFFLVVYLFGFFFRPRHGLDPLGSGGGLGVGWVLVFAARLILSLSFFGFFFLVSRRPPRSPLFPYAMLFR